MNAHGAEPSDLGDELDHVAGVELAGCGVNRRPIAEGAIFRLDGHARGAVVELGHAYQAHLWLETAGGWRSDTVDSDHDDLLAEWSEMLQLAKRIAGGAETPVDDGKGAWVSTSGYRLGRRNQPGDGSLHSRLWRRPTSG